MLRFCPVCGSGPVGLIPCSPSAADFYKLAPISFPLIHPPIADHQLISLFNNTATIDKDLQGLMASSASAVLYDLTSLISSKDRDFLIRNNGDRVKISSLIGKNVGLYFSASWCPHSRRFNPILAGVYKELASKGDFEVIFISSDRDEDSYNNYFSKMPWLSVPLSDSATRKRLTELFNGKGIPHLVVLDPNGKVSTHEGVTLVSEHGANAYEQLKKELEEAKGWPEKLKHKLHKPHELVRTRRSTYVCDGCDGKGSGWSFCCEECDFDFHPKCALTNEVKVNSNEEGKKGWVC